MKVSNDLTADVFQRALDALLPAGPPTRHAVLAGPGRPSPTRASTSSSYRSIPRRVRPGPCRPGCIRIPGAPAAGGVAVAGLSPAVRAGSRVGRHTPRRPPRRPAPASPLLPVPGRPGNVPAHLGPATSRSQPMDAHDPREPHTGQVGRPLLAVWQSDSTRLSCLPKWSTSAVHSQALVQLLWNGDAQYRRGCR